MATRKEYAKPVLNHVVLRDKILTRIHLVFWMLPIKNKKISNKDTNQILINQSSALL